MGAKVGMAAHISPRICASRGLDKGAGAVTHGDGPCPVGHRALGGGGVWGVKGAGVARCHVGHVPSAACPRKGRRDVILRNVRKLAGRL